MNASDDLKVSIPEVRELIRMARSYVAGETHFSYLCNAIGTFREAARLLPPGNAIRKMSEDWATMAIRVWPEMAGIENPISDDEFREWVRVQLVVFEPEVMNSGSLDA